MLPQATPPKPLGAARVRAAAAMKLAVARELAAAVALLLAASARSSQCASRRLQEVPAPSAGAPGPTGCAIGTMQTAAQRPTWRPPAVCFEIQILAQNSPTGARAFGACLFSAFPARIGALDELPSRERASRLAPRLLPRGPSELAKLHLSSRLTCRPLDTLANQIGPPAPKLGNLDLKLTLKLELKWKLKMNRN